MKEIELSLFKVVFAMLNEKQQLGETITLKLIKEEVEVFQILPKFKEADFNLVINALEGHFTIGIGKSETLYQNRIPWISEYKSKHPKLEDFSFWNNYKRYLLEEVKLPSVVVDEIDDSTDAILDGMENPGNGLTFAKKGMVIGYVQSGKTGNYVGLINKALDVGYSFIVVLAGLHNNLRQQTQFRIDQGVNGLQKINGVSKTVGVGKLHDRFTSTHTQTLTTSDIMGDFKKNAKNMTGVNFNIPTPLIAVIKKNTTPLTNLNEWLDDVLKQNNELQSHRAVLVIDDECDQASINNNFDWEHFNNPIPNEDGTIDPANTPSKINELINELLNKFSRRAYVGYTATPYANVFIPINELEKNFKDIFPEDFIVRLDQPTNYLGPEKYFNDSEDAEGLPGILEIDDNETFIEQIKSFNNGNTAELEIPNSLQTATKLFVLSGGLRYFRNQENAHMSMLIHISHLTNIQNHLGKSFNVYWKNLVNDIKQNKSSVWIDLENIYIGEYSVGLNEKLQSQEYVANCFFENNAFKTNNFDLPSEFSSLRDHIIRFISSVEIIVTNSSSENKRDKNNNKKSDEEINLNYHLYPKGRKIIAIGGNTMSRGLTFEGLHTSYFVRNAKAFDTLMQMGRWFGYRTNYADLCRIITTKDIVMDFNEICLADIIMNQNISAMIRSNATPRDFLIQVRQSSTSLKITTKMGAAGPMSISWAGGEVISSAIERKAETIIHNHNILITLLNLIKENYLVDKQPNKLIIKEVPLVMFEEFIKPSGYSLVNNDGSLDFEKIFEYYKKCGFENIDLVVLGRQKGQDDDDVNFTFLDTEIGLAKRSSKDPLNQTFFKVRNGKLTDADYLASFVDEKLSAEDRKKPSVVCTYLKRPVITFLAMNPKYFFLSKELQKSKIPSEDDVYLDLMNNIGGFNQNQIIPYGISIATPSKGKNGNNLTRESVLINLAVKRNIEK